MSIDEVVNKFGKEILSQPTQDCFIPRANKNPKNALEALDSVATMLSPRYGYRKYQLEQ